MSILTQSRRLPRTIVIFACAWFVLAIGASAAFGSLAFRGAQVHSLWSSVSRSEMTEELNELQAAGVNVLRVDVGWASLETAKGSYEPSYLAKLDALAAEAQARGIRLIATLWWTPRWASVGGAWNDAPSNPADYGAFARFITARYGTELAGVEAWNEPEINSNLLAVNLPETYARMVRAFYTGAKEGNSSVPVLAGSLAYADVTFLGELYAYGIKGYYDAISVHPYADGAAPENTTVTHSFLGGIEKLHQFQLANGDSAPEWVTEFGWPVGTSPGANSEQQQAEYTEKAFGLLNGLPYVTGATVYQLRDMETNAANAEDNFGLLRQDFTARPAYTAFKRAMAGGSTSTPTPPPTTTSPTPPTSSEPAPTKTWGKHSKAHSASASATTARRTPITVSARRRGRTVLVRGRAAKSTRVVIKLECPVRGLRKTVRRFLVHTSGAGRYAHSFQIGRATRGCVVSTSDARGKALSRLRAA